MTKARLIGEKSAGRTAVEIWENDNLLWSHMYFVDGATHQEYIDGLCQAYDDMINCNDWNEYEGCDRDDDGEVIEYGYSETSGIICEYDSDTNAWTMGDRYGQSDEILDALMLIGEISADNDHVDQCHDEIVDAVCNYIIA